jgi:hypothetical protein
VFIFLDYSEIYYRAIGKSSIPDKRLGKFVQVRNNSTEYLVLSPKGLSVYHANIVERFFSQRNIEGKYNSKGDYFEISEGEWEVTGGGIWAINETDRLLRLSGSSQAYGQYDRRGLRERIETVEEVSGYRIVID